MKYWIIILVLLSSLQVNAECYPVLASTLAPDLNTAYSVPNIGFGPFYEGFGWDTLSSKVTGQYNGIGEPGIYLTTEHLKASRDGKYLAGVASNYIMAWDIKSQARVWTQRTESYYNSIGFYEVAGNNLVFTSLKAYGGSIRSFTVVDLVSKKVIYHSDASADANSQNASVALSENGEILFYTEYISTTDQYRLVRIDIATGGKTEVPIKDYKPKIYVKGDLVYTFDGWLRTYKTSDLSLMTEVKYPNYLLVDMTASHLQISLDKNLIKMSARVVADLKTGKTLFVLPTGFKDSFLSEDGARFAATSTTGAVYIYDTSTWQLISKTCADL